jgi:acyl-coenzyme A synthetase/AMP-(fatty) acid ligase
MVRLVGRKKDVIKCSGYSVYSKEVEEVLVSHPAVAKAAVVGVPHPQKGEAPIGIIELTEGSTLNEEDLVVWCRGQIAPYKAPRRIHIVEKGVLPQGMTEKVLKRVLRERYLNDFTEIPDK